MTVEVQVRLTLVTIGCAACAMTFGVPQRFYSDRRRDHRTFYCPNGHPNFWPQESDVERAERLLRDVRAQRDHARELAEYERRRHSATKGKLTRERKRVAAGVCPCCRRTFQNLGRHMAGQHPEYAAGTEHVKAERT